MKSDPQISQEMRMQLLHLAQEMLRDKQEELNKGTEKEKILMGKTKRPAPFSTEDVIKEAAKLACFVAALDSPIKKEEKTEVPNETSEVFAKEMLRAAADYLRDYADGISVKEHSVGCIRTAASFIEKRLKAADFAQREREEKTEVNKPTSGLTDRELRGEAVKLLRIYAKNVYDTEWCPHIRHIAKCLDDAEVIQ